LPAYLVAGFGGLVAAIATGQAALAALGAPFVVLSALGLMHRQALGATGSVALTEARVIEGDVVAGDVVVDWDGEAEVEVMLTAWRGVTPVDPSGEVAWALPAGRGPVRLPFRLRAASWGVHDLGVLWIRARRPGGLLVWEEKLAAAPSLRVLPNALRLDRMLRPAEPRAVSGMHLSRRRGQGTDFAELRPYRPGDRLRDLSWGTSARLGEPWVTVHHPERTGTLVLVLDATFSDGSARTEALARAARAAWAVASVHLRAQDRVGFLATGRTAAWVSPQGGRRARWVLIDELLRVGGAAENESRQRRQSRRVVMPSDALVVGITSLRARSVSRQLLHYRRTGHATAALIVDTADLLADADGRPAMAARRLWLLQREVERQHLERGGVPTALIDPDAGVAPALSSLRRRMGSARMVGL
jgi:uncharacterized protein (DUF58 family)